MDSNHTFRFKDNYATLLVIVFILLEILCSPLYADAQRIQELQHDSVGNIVRINYTDQLNPPNVTALNPGFINIGSTATITATGTDLLVSKVTTTATGLSISNVKSTQTQVTFDISANQNAILGSTPLIFTTGLGSDSISIIVAEAIPNIVTNPNPITIAADNLPNIIQIIFTDPRPTRETYIISTLDPLTATLSNSSFTIATGATQAQFQLTGLAFGSTILNVALAQKFFFLNFPVFVGENFTGNGYFSSPTFGLFLESQNNNINNAVISQSVGVFVPLKNSASQNNFVSEEIGIYLEPHNTNVNGSFFSNLIGVFTGSNITNYVPALLQTGQQIDILMNGSNLDEVTNITIEPAGVITVDSFLSTQNGNSLTVSISVDPLAPTGNYQLIITTDTNEVALAQGNRVTLTIP